MADIIEEGFKNIFLAGVGALAITGERAKEVVDSLIEKGGITVEQGKDINAELTHKGSETINKLRADSLAQVLKGMTLKSARNSPLRSPSSSRNRSLSKRLRRRKPNSIHGEARPRARWPRLLLSW